MPGLEPVTTYGAFLGLKITLKPVIGWNSFSGGDIETAIGGFYDKASADIPASGAAILRSDKESSHAGLEAGGDIIYAITPLFGIGIGGVKVSTGSESQIVFQQEQYGEQNLRIRPRISVSALRAGLFYTFPFANQLGISIHGGPALYYAEYSLSLSGSGSFMRHGLVHTGYYQAAKAKQVGFEGGLGFEFNPNPFVAIFVEAQGRYAKIGGFEGEEQAQFFQDGQYQKSANAGPIHFVETEGYPTLEVGRSGGAGSARQAVLNFSGFTFLGGLKLRL